MTTRGTSSLKNATKKEAGMSGLCLPTRVRDHVDSAVGQMRRRPGYGQVLRIGAVFRAAAAAARGSRASRVLELAV